MELTFPEGKQLQIVVESIFSTIGLGFLGRKQSHSTSAFITPGRASRLTQSTEHLCDGVFDAEAMFFTEDGGGAVLDELVGPADANDRSMNASVAKLFNDSGAEAVAQDVVLEGADNLHFFGEG